jgi:trimethylamine:corrinoid methyltransferase-like protein
MKVLCETGVVVPVGQALEIFRKHGIRVDGQRVYLDEARLVVSLLGVAEV